MTSVDVGEVRDLVKEQLACSFHGPYRDGPYPRATVSSVWGPQNQRQTPPHRDALLQKVLIWAPRRGQVDFTVPLFAEFLRDHHPMTAFDQA
jgi:hypothetical protein